MFCVKIRKMLLKTHFSLIDYLVFVFLLLSSTLIGVFFWWKSRNNSTTKEFLTGNRQLGVFPVTLSLVASFMSSNTILGLPAEVFQVGTQYFMQIISICISFTLAALVFMPIYYKLELISVNEYLYQRFGSECIRLAGTIGFLLATLPYMAVILYGPSIALSSVTPLSIPMCIILVGIICTVYTSIGGIKAVIWTDVLQCILLFLGLLMVIVEGAIELGGLSEIWRINEEGGRLKFLNLKFDLYNNDNFWNIIAGTVVFWSSAYCVMQTQVQRYNSLDSIEKARISLFCNLPAVIIMTTMAVMCGSVIYAKYHDCDPVTLGLIQRHDQLMPFFVMDTLGKYPGLPGLFVVSIFSGSLSTLSSGFNALAAVTWEDLFKNRIKVSPKQELTITKLIAYGVLTICLSFGLGNIGTVLQACLALVGSMFGPLLAMFCLGLFYPYATAAGSLIGFTSGICISLVISVGSIVIPRPKIAMPTSLDGCPTDILIYAFERYNGLPNSSFVESYTNPEGLAKIFHISYLLLSVIGFLVALITGMILSLIIGERQKSIDTSLMSPLHKYIFPCYKPSINRSEFAKNLDHDNYQTNLSFNFSETKL